MAKKLISFFINLAYGKVKMKRWVVKVLLVWYSYFTRSTGLSTFSIFLSTRIARLEIRRSTRSTRSTICRGICISRALALALAPNPNPQFVFTGPEPQFVFSGPGSQFVCTGPGPQFVFTSPGTQFVFGCSFFYS